MGSIAILSLAAAAFLVVGIAGPALADHGGKHLQIVLSEKLSLTDSVKQQLKDSMNDLPLNTLQRVELERALANMGDLAIIQKNDEITFLYYGGELNIIQKSVLSFAVKLLKQ